MHEVKIGGSVIDFLTGELRERTSYEDLRQELLRFVAQKMNYPRECLKAHFPFRYKIESETFSREIDLLVGYPLIGCPLKDEAQTNLSPDESYLQEPDSSLEQFHHMVFGDKYAHLLIFVFVPGQVATYKREVMAMARLMGSSLAAITDMSDFLLFSSCKGEELLCEMEDFPTYGELIKLAAKEPRLKMTEEKVLMESRLLHAYTGLLKSCCNSACVFPDLK